MDEKAIDAKGLAPLEPELDRIRALSRTRRRLAGEIAHLHPSAWDALFEFNSGQDFKDSNEVIAQFDQGGLGLPDRDYYLKDDAKSVELRQKYVAHVQRMFELAGEKPSNQAKADAAAVMQIETALAKGSLDLVSRRDPEKVYHKIGKPELAALSPAFRWNEYFAASGAPAFQSINVSYPEFVKAIDAAIEARSAWPSWKTYLTWHLVHSPCRRSAHGPSCRRTSISTARP
jgi:putative endopeptidase